MNTVTVVLGSGLGNRFFKVAAMLGYAERYGHTPVFVTSLLHDEPSHPGPYGITELFPAIPVVSETTATELRERHEDVFTYRPLPRVTGSVTLNGYYQAHQYFPTVPIPVPSLLAHGPRRPTTYFFHVRRGDYLNPLCAHHNVPLQRYWERCLSLIPVGNETRFLVCSDDIPWCKATLPALLAPWITSHQWEFFEATDADTLANMIGCEQGGICANSTFSWWAAYWIQNKEKRIFMPATWGFPPMPVARDVWPPWALQVST